MKKIMLYILFVMLFASVSYAFYFKADFDNCGHCGFQPVYGGWSPSNGKYRASSTLFVDYAIVPLNELCKDCTYTVEVNASGAFGRPMGTVSLIGGLTINGEKYKLTLDYRNNIVSVIGVNGSTLAGVNYNLLRDTEYIVSMDIKGKEIHGSINGNKIISARSTDLIPAGSGGLENMGNGVVTFDDFVMFSDKIEVNVTNIGGGSNPQMCRISGNPFDIEFTFEPNENFYRVGNLSNTTVVGNLTFAAKNLQGTNYAIRYTIDDQDRNKTLSYGFEEFGFAPLFKFGVLHVDLASPLAFDGTSTNPSVTVPISKELLEKTLYLQAVAFNTQELVLSDGYKVTLPKGSDQQQKPPIAQWNFDEGNGTTTQDASGNGNHGNLLGNILWTNDSRSGYALDFDGVDDKISIASRSLGFIDAVTIEAWIKRKGNADGMIVSKNAPYFLAVRNNVIEGGIYTNNWAHIKGRTPLQQNMWYKLKITFDGRTINLYVNDILEEAVPKTGRMQHGSDVWIGWGEPGHDQHFKGIIDDVAIYDYAKE